MVGNWNVGIISIVIALQGGVKDGVVVLIVVLRFVVYNVVFCLENSTNKLLYQRDPN